MTHVLDNLAYNTDLQTSSSYPKEPTTNTEINSKYDSISALIHDLRLNVKDKVEKHHVQSALRILFWPSNENVWDKAEEICMNKAKQIFGKLLGNDSNLDIDSNIEPPDLNLKDCLQTLVYLGEMRESQ